MPNTQYQLPLMCLLSGTQNVPQSEVDQWASPADAARWSFEHRIGAAGKPKSWFAEHLQMRRQHITRMLDRGDLKLDSVQAHMWDWLTGWTALAQYTEAAKKRIVADASERIAEAMKVRLQA